MKQANGAAPSGFGARRHASRWRRWLPGGDPARWQRPLGDGRIQGHGANRWLRGRRSLATLGRGREDAMIGGVATGLAEWTGFDVTAVRTAFVVATLAGGFGMAAYVSGWLLLPAAGESGNIASKALADRRGLALAAGLGSLLIVVFLIASAVGAGWLSSFAWPLVISAAGIALIWRNAPANEQTRMRRLVEPVRGLAEGSRRSQAVLRLSVASLLLAGGLLTLLLGRASYALLRPLAGVTLVIAAIVMILGPWWLRIARDLMVERQARVRAEERADIAARVHDSVLQTLALIQRRADQPQQVIQLARAQERELRCWLFDGPAPGSANGQGMTLAAALRLMQREVEAQHGVAVEIVSVGDCEIDDDLAALLAAGREATVNAMKWSGASVVSLFAEVEPAKASLFVRDRGRGFDPRAVPGDRKGLTESIQARMARRGGSATVRSVLGEGTEVSLAMPRAAGRRPAGRS